MASHTNDSCQPVCYLNYPTRRDIVEASHRHTRIQYRSSTPATGYIRGHPPPPHDTLTIHPSPHHDTVEDIHLHAIIQLKPPIIMLEFSRNHPLPRQNSVEAIHRQARIQFRPPIATPGPWFNIKMSSYQYRKSHCGDLTTVLSPQWDFLSW